MKKMKNMKKMKMMTCKEGGRLVALHVYLGSLEDGEVIHAVEASTHRPSKTSGSEGQAGSEKRFNLGFVAFVNNPLGLLLGTIVNVPLDVLPSLVQRTPTLTATFAFGSHDARSEWV